MANTLPSTTLENVCLKSDEELSDFVKELERKTKEKYYRRDAQPKAKLKSQSRKTANNDLKYYNIFNECVHGPSRQSISRGIRVASTRKLGCPGSLRFKLSANGHYYSVVDVVKHVGHEEFKHFNEHLSENRKLNEAQKNFAIQCLQVGCNKMQLIQQLSTMGNRPAVKDISNLEQSLKVDKKKDDLSSVVKMLEKYNVSYEILIDDDVFQSIYFYDKNMEKTLKAWPEVLFIDGTYKLLKIRYTVVLIAVVDGMGQTEIASVCIMKQETEEVFRWFISCFKKAHEEACQKIQCVMGDKDLVGRKVIKEILQVPMYICLFHVQKAMRNAINNDKMGITKDEREKVLQMLQKMVYSHSSEQYDETYEIFIRTVPQTVIDYFNNNWHNIKQEWVYYALDCNFLNDTNNRLESLNGTLKKKIGIDRYFLDFIELFFIHMQQHYTDRDRVASDCILRKSALSLKYDDLDEYKKKLTRYAYNALKNEYDRMRFSEDAKITEITPETFEIRSKNIIREVTLNKCSCKEFKAMRLPCRHIFMVRYLKGVSLFDSSLYADRWSTEYFKHHQRNLSVAYPAKDDMKNDDIIPDTDTQTENAAIPLGISNLDIVQMLPSTSASINNVIPENVAAIPLKVSNLDMVKMIPSTSASINNVYLKDIDIFKKPEKVTCPSSEEMTLSITAECGTSRDNSIVFSALSNDVVATDQDYQKLKHFINVLSNQKVKAELQGILYPVFCHLYLEMLHAGNRQAAIQFMKSHQADFTSDAERDFLEELSSVFSIQDIELRPFVNAFRTRKYKVDLSDEAHIALQKFLSKHDHVILMQVINTHVTVIKNLYDLHSMVDEREEDGLKKRADVAINGHVEQPCGTRVLLKVRNLDMVQMIPKSNTKGRPKGSVVAVIGTRKRRKHNSNETKCSLPKICKKGASAVLPKIPVGSKKGASAVLPKIPVGSKKGVSTVLPKIPVGSKKYTDMTNAEKCYIILQKCITSDILLRICDGSHVIVEDHIHIKQEFQCWFRDELVNLNVLKECLHDTLCKVIETQLKSKENYEWLCEKCNKSLCGKQYQCDKCLTWFHKKCANIKTKLNSSENWFCDKCK